MNRVELKNKAKEMIKGNKWYILKPVIIFGLVFGLIAAIAFGLDSALGLTKTTIDELTGLTRTSGGIISDVVSIVLGIAGSAFSIGYAMYLLSFVRGTKLELRDIVDFMKKHWVIAFLTSILVGLIVCGCTILLVIPGIIAAIGLTFYQEVCADNPEMRALDIIKRSWAITKDHKMDIFVLGLSFIGWCIVAAFTLGILYIWLYPYMVVTMTLAYEELKKAA